MVLYRILFDKPPDCLIFTSVSIWGIHYFKCLWAIFTLAMGRGSWYIRTADEPPKRESKRERIRKREQNIRIAQIFRECTKSSPNRFNAT